ncbi:Molybdopterin converting factor, small subunit [Streptoalloteichus tenebrarius]|uniref:Molybdopterin synthase sulfur carrier subunit n=1 Tax=Streptoalloteichus tenebrarius (strain ATCC 17920 / DSM 40477 / JCM 4838 / CBS 697.72 / NBRC 16177 / NCIMB 11028 / NRRL B-12390 / A12253. 1 / ISP 5477) TaxID=1933 RepID=A0ABT1HVL3_STRSD|nr:MoaD/ThiS family protein [Streptoalloteichus tenebrarius]MCP2259507.1 Molybdopterin converting factor, small subunit [Streptoalloteichus tenebrarius]BFF01412.1 MoaD/ThiS family protein [Streptoalloteichus tenebrarius]
MAEQATSTRVTVRYFAGARAAAGTPEEVLELPAGSTVAQVLAELERRRGEKLSRVLAACSFLVNGTAVRDREAIVPDGGELDVLPPFAGG